MKLALPFLIMLTGCASPANHALATFDSAHAMAIAGERIAFHSPVAPRASQFVTARSKAQPLVVLPRPPIAKVPMTVTFKWIPAEDDDAAYYNFYYGTGPRDYTEMIPCTGTTVTITGLTGGQAIYCGVTAAGGDGDGDFSDETIFTPAVMWDLFPSTSLVAPVSHIESSTDFVNWTPHAAAFTNGAWRITATDGAPMEFYRERMP